MSEEKKYYVYVHRYASGPKQDEVFYVGKGCGNRAYSKNDRNERWNRVAKKYGFTWDIVFKTNFEPCAFSFEKVLIFLYGIENLCNVSHGGEGVSWGGTRPEYIGSGNPKYDNVKYTFLHSDHGVFVGTKFEFIKAFGIPHSSVYSLFSGKRKHASGWHLEGVTPNFQKGNQHPFFDPTEYDFFHEDHGVVRTTRYELCKEYNLSRSNLNEMMRGRYKTTKGWTLL